jgi:hypothetical protein
MPHSLSRCCPGETLVSSLSGTRSRDWVPDGERFPCLTSLFIDPLGPDPLLRYFEQHPYANNRSARTVTIYLIAVGRPTTSVPPRHLPGGATRADLEAFLADPLARRPAPTTTSSNSLRLVDRGRASHQPDPVGRLVTPQGEHPGAREDLSLRPLASHAGALSPFLQGQGVVRINDDHLLDGWRRHYTADQIRAGCTPGTARPRLALRHASPVNYLSLERGRVGRLRPQPCRPGSMCWSVSQQGVSATNWP